MYSLWNQRDMHTNKRMTCRHACHEEMIPHPVYESRLKPLSHAVYICLDTDIISQGHEAANLLLESHLPQSTALLNANSLILLSMGLGQGVAGNALSTI